MGVGKGVFIVLPAYNEEKSIGTVLDGLRKAGYRNLVVVDDGSRDRTEDIALENKAIVLKHVLNRGLGGALGTAIKAAIIEGADIIVTFDSDGQHSVEDIPRVIKPILEGQCDVVIGSRVINKEGMPLIKRVGNAGLNFFTFLLFGVYCSDTQSGLRAFSREAAKKIEIRSNGYEVSSEIIKEIGRNRLRMKEVPITTIYTKYSMARGTNVITGFRILIGLTIKKFFR